MGGYTDLEGRHVHILNLHAWRLLSVQEARESHRISAEYTVAPTACPHCASASPPTRFGTYEQHFLDVPLQEKRVEILVQRRRYRCRDCRKTFAQALPDMDGNRFMTKRLVATIEQRCLSQTFTSLAEQVGVVEGTIRAIFRDYLRREARAYHIVTPRWLAIDEVSLLGRPRCILANVEERTVIDLLDARSQPALEQWLRRVLNRGQIDTVWMGLWQPYRQAVREVLPQATIAVGQFRVGELADLAVEFVRKEACEPLADRQRRALAHDRFILLKRRQDLAEKEAFYDIWRADTQEGARTRYVAWREQTPREIRQAFAPLRSTVEAWGDEIFATLPSAGSATEAYARAMGDLAELAPRIGRASSFEAMRAKVLYTPGVQKRRAGRAETGEPQAPGNGASGVLVEIYGTDIAALSERLHRGPY